MFPIEFPTERDKVNMIKGCYPDGWSLEEQFKRDAIEDEPEIYRLTDAEVANPFEQLQASVQSGISALAEKVQPTETDWRATQLARELCRAQGYDPDMMVVNVLAGRQGPFGSVGASDTVPAWTLYLEMARSLSDALDVDMTPKTMAQ